MNRCPWCEKDDLYITYHDREWGVPVHDEKKHFEFLLLETMQAGLNWYVILKKRENFRKAFDGFNYKKIKNYNKAKIKKLLKNRGIIRNRRKIESAINNAQCFVTIQKEFKSFDNYIWRFVNYRPIKNAWKFMRQIPVKTKLSDTISNDLKKRGFKFVGSITMYAHLQAIGIVNDHLVHCFRYNKIKPR